MRPKAETSAPPPAPRPEASVTPGTKTDRGLPGRAGRLLAGGDLPALRRRRRHAACHSFEDIFHAIEEGRATHGLLPVENSQAGSINQAYDLLLDHDLRVIGEVKLRVRHCLLAAPGTSTADIDRVRSHPQALAQCERYLRNRGWEAVPGYDTAGSAHELAANPEPGTAVIASALAGQTYGLEVLAIGIEDSPENATRFFVLGREDLPPARATRRPSSSPRRTRRARSFHALGEFAEPRHQPDQDREPSAAQPSVALCLLRGHGRPLQRHRRGSGAEQPARTRTAFVKLLGQLPGRAGSARDT